MKDYHSTFKETLDSHNEKLDLIKTQLLEKLEYCRLAVAPIPGRLRSQVYRRAKRNLPMWFYHLCGAIFLIPIFSFFSRRAKSGAALVFSFLFHIIGTIAIFSYLLNISDDFYFLHYQGDLSNMYKWIFPLGYMLLLQLGFVFFYRWKLRRNAKEFINKTCFGFENLIAWAFRHYDEQNEFPLIGYRTPTAQESEWLILERYNFRLNDNSVLIENPILFCLTDDEGAGKLGVGFMKGRKMVPKIVFNNFKCNNFHGRILEKSIRKTLKRTPKDLKDHLSAACDRFEEFLKVRQMVKNIENLMAYNFLVKHKLDSIFLQVELKNLVEGYVKGFLFEEDTIPPSLLLCGGEGVGKTMLVKTICELSGQAGFYLDPSYFANSEHEKYDIAASIFNKFSEKQPSEKILFVVDDIDRIFYPGMDEEDSAERQFLITFIELFQKARKSANIWFVATASNPNKIHAKIRGLIARVEKIGKISDEGIRFVIHQAMQEANLQQSIHVGGNDPMVEAMANLSPKSIYSAVHLAKEIASPGNPSLQHFKDAASRLKNINGTTVNSDASWETLILPMETVSKLQGILRIIQKQEEFQAQGVDVPGGLLLYGPPGTGKTQIARTIANESGLAFKAVSGSDLKGAYIGWGAKQTREVFEVARGMSPCILFIDEIDSCAKRRDGSSSDSIGEEVVNQILVEMDGVSKQGDLVFVIAATNMISNIDAAVLSRFTDRVEIPLPGPEEIKKLFCVLLANVELAFDLNDALEELSKAFAGSSGRDLKNIVSKAQRKAIGRSFDENGERVILQLDDLLSALDSKTKTSDQVSQVWDTIILPESIKSTLKRMVELFNSNSAAAPGGLLLYGPPGTGKSLIAKRIAESSNSTFITANLAELKGRYLGEGAQNSKDLWSKARQAGKAVIFLDECDSLFAARGGMDSDTLTKEVLTTFLSEWDGVANSGRIWVVGATNRKEAIDTAILQRFGETLEIPNPDGEARVKIFEKELADLGVKVSLPSDFAELSSGLSGRMLGKVARKLVTVLDENIPLEEQVKAALLEVQGTLKTATTAGASWDSLVISEALEEQLKEIGTTLQHIDYFKKSGIEPPTGLIMYGPPGTGKTQIARTLASESGVGFIAASTADVKGQYVGESVQKTASLFSRARELSPCILFLDEIENIVPARGTGGDQYAAEILTQILQEMDGIKGSNSVVFVVAATNHLEQIDPAILSRFADKVEVALPGEIERERMLKVFLGDVDCEFDKDEWAKNIASKTGGFSGRDLNNFVKKGVKAAAMRAVRQGAVSAPVVELDDFQNL